MPVQRIVITLNEDGQADISAPLTNKILCYGMLAIAHDMVKDYKPEAKPTLQIVGANDVPNLKGSH